MTRPQVRRVAVIGAGVSGVVSAAHLLAAGLDVTVFERSHAAGGVWLYDERVPLEPSYSTLRPLESEQQWDRGFKDPESAVLSHAPPGPCYEGLKNNVSTPLMRVKLNAWPEGTPDFVSHHVMKDYIQDTSKKTGVHDVTIYGARVKKTVKEGQSWRVTWSHFTDEQSAKEVEESALFDYLIVASGHYHVPRIPDLPGLVEAKSRWPDRILHSKGYRRPDSYAGKNVLLIGGGVSAVDIAREVGPLAEKVYQSTRNGEFDLTASVLPSNGIRISEISALEIEGKDASLSSDEALPLTVHLKSGQKLCGIDNIVICTGYHITVPFLREYHNDKLTSEEADDSILVTDGTQVHNLHKDIFYIPDPTLLFIGVPYYTATYTLFEFQAIVVANVLSGIADLPSESDMRQEYLERIKSVGSGKRFHSLKDKEEVYVEDVLGWVNAYREKKGLVPVEGHTKAWLEAKEVQRGRMKELFGDDSVRRDSGIAELPVLGTCN